MSDLMESAGDKPEIPAISRRVRQVRERKHEEWVAEHGTERGSPYTQEAMARAMSLSLSGYGNLERGKTEPNLHRLRQIAMALGLDEDYFAPTGNLASATIRVEAEADRLRTLGDQLQDVLGALTTLVPALQRERTPDAPDEEPPRRGRVAQPR